jgi:transcriptional regulator with XRE-family HTH domain
MPRQLDPGASPMHFFGSEVRHARTAAGMTQAELGGLLGYDASEVSKVEAGAREPSARFAEGCDKAFPHMNGWFTRFYQYCGKWEGPYPRWFVDWVEAEGQAARLWVWQPMLVPGLLQTAEYARALFRAWQVADTEEEIEQLVAARLDRQRIFGRDRPPSVWAVIDEAVLHRPVGGAKVMHDQLEHLADMSCRPRVSVQVIPAEVGAHAGLLGGVSIAGFADDAPGIVYLDTSDQGQTFKAPEVVARMFTIFDTLRSEALPRGASRDLIGKVASERWTP